MKKTIIYLSGIMIWLGSISVCKAQNLSTVRHEIEKANAVYYELFQKKDLAIVNLYAIDGALLSPNVPAIRGRAALIQDFKNAFAGGDINAGGNIKGVKFTTMSLYGDGASFVTEEGTWQLIGVKGNVITTGKYLKLWKSTKQGWKIFRDIFNGDTKN